MNKGDRHIFSEWDEKKNYRNNNFNRTKSTHCGTIGQFRLTADQCFVSQQIGQLFSNQLIANVHKIEFRVGVQCLPSNICADNP